MHNQERDCGSKLIDVSVCGDRLKVLKSSKVGCRKPVLRVLVIFVVVL